MKRHPSFFTPSLFIHAVLQAFLKLNPLSLYRNPILLLTEAGALVTTIDIFNHFNLTNSFTFHISIWLWFTVLFSNFAEAIAERRNKAQADFLRSSRKEIWANKIVQEKETVRVHGSQLQKEDLVVIRAGETIPSDGEITEGSASIDESAVTGESQPVIRSSGTDQNTVTAGSKVLSDEITVRVTNNPGESFLDHMIRLIEGAKRQKTANEIALTILLSSLSFLFLSMIISLQLFGFYYHIALPITMQVALLVCLIPTTIAGLLSSIGIAGINRLMRHNVLSSNRQSVEAAGDVSILLIDKTGTITSGDRKAYELLTEESVDEKKFLEAALLSSLDDETTEGRSIVELLYQNYPLLKKATHPKRSFIPFSAYTRMSGVDIGAKSYRKGAPGAIEKFAKEPLSRMAQKSILEASKEGATALVVASSSQILGIIFLKDSIKSGLSEKFASFRKMGIRTVMITGDNHLTAGAIANEVGVDDYLSEVTPQAKLHYLRGLQRQGFLVAMTGDGVNDAPALAQADLGVAMNAGTEAAKEAANMVDLDSSPTKLFTIIEIGKQMLMTRGALTTLSIANDLAKYFAIIPAMLTPYFPFFQAFNIMRLSTPQNAVLSTVIFNALIIVFLIPLSLKGIKLVVQETSKTINHNLLVYGLGGVLLPFLGIKVIDLIITTLHLS